LDGGAVKTDGFFCRFSPDLVTGDDHDLRFGQKESRDCRQFFSAFLAIVGWNAFAAGSSLLCLAASVTRHPRASGDAT
jgi:hypothetical protein